MGTIEPLNNTIDVFFVDSNNILGVSPKTDRSCPEAFEVPRGHEWSHLVNLYFIYAYFMPLVLSHVIFNGGNCTYSVL